MKLLEIFALVNILGFCLAAPSSSLDEETGFNFTELIYGGQPARDGQFPYQVYLDLGNNGCGGTIYDATTVVMAAHCHFDGNYNRIPYYQVTAYAGSINRRGGQRRSASGTYVHQSYNANSDGGYYDIAIVKLSQPFSFNNNLRSIQMAGRGVKMTSGTCVLSGFGSTTNHQGNMVDQLRYANLALKPDSSCTYDAGHYDPSSMICAGGDGSNQCAGDSGGPLVCGSGNNAFLYGIVSRGPINCAERNAGSYTSASYYRDWIDQIARGNW